MCGVVDRVSQLCSPNQQVTAFCLIRLAQQTRSSFQICASSDLLMEDTRHNHSLQKSNFQMTLSVTRRSILYFSWLVFSNSIHPIKDINSIQEQWRLILPLIFYSGILQAQKNNACIYIAISEELWYQSCGMRLLSSLARNANARLEWCGYVPTWVNISLLFLRYLRHDHVPACIQDHNSKPNCSCFGTLNLWSDA